jgi:hypothetical protein
MSSGATQASEEQQISCDLTWFAERDIDVWLSEELRVNAAFADWFLKKIGNALPIAGQPPGHVPRFSTVH